MSDRENREQIPTEYNEEETQKILRRQEQVPGERRGKTVSDFPQAAILVQDLDFPADRSAILRHAEQSNAPESRKLLPLVQKIKDRQYSNVSDAAEAARLVQ